MFYGEILTERSVADIRIKKFYFKLNMNMLLFFSGVIMGTVIINMFCNKYGLGEEDTLSAYFATVGSYDSFGSVFGGLLIRRLLMAAFLFSILLLINNIWIVYISLATAGGLVGVVMTILSMNVGLKGISLFILLCFPHVFLYTAAIFIVVRMKFSGYYTERIKQSYKQNFFSGNINKKKGYAVAAVIFLVGIFAETLNALYILPAALPLFW